MQDRLAVNVRSKLKEKRLEVKYLVTGGLLFLLLIALSASRAFATIEHDVVQLLEAATNVGLVGLFFVAFFSNLVVIVNIPFMLVALPWVLLNPTPADVLAFSIVTGVGAGAGKLIAYLLASRVAQQFDALSDSPLHAWISTQVSERPRFAPALVFVAAATVLPLDPALIPLLLVGYPAHKVSMPLILGKIGQSLSLALVALLMSDQIGLGGGMNVDMTFGVVLVTLLLMAYQVEKARAAGADVVAEPVLVPVSTGVHS